MPSGRRVELRPRVVAAPGPDRGDEGELARAFDFVSGAVELVGKEGRVPFDTLSLEDANMLRALFAQLGHIEEPEVEVTCENCGARQRVRPSSCTELSPYVDDQLGDPELDAPFPFGQALEIPPVRTERGVATDVVFAPRTVAEAEPLWRRPTDAPWTFTPRVVAAMGVRRLGRETRLAQIAEALRGASEAARSAILDHFESACYGPRLVGLARCTCDARLDVPGPVPSELGERHRVRREAPASGPDLDTFDAHVAAMVERVFARRRVQNVNVVVEPGVAACDDGGTPLLGSYGPGDFDEAPPEIRLYYRTFCAEVEADPTFDWRKEVEETIDHELEHHVNFLAGDDPLDDEERAAIAQEQLRRVGKDELARRAVSAVVGDAFSFVRVAWPFLLLLLVLAYLMYFR